MGAIGTGTQACGAVGVVFGPGVVWIGPGGVVGGIGVTRDGSV
jgi:hypothetical protein